MNQINELKEDNRRYIKAIIEKAEKVCPGSLSMVGIGGSFLTGDVYDKSDLDLLLLINDNNGWKIKTTFIRDDRGIGYDFYCQSWEDLEKQSEYPHPHISKFLEAKIVWCADDRDRDRLEELRAHCRGILEAPFCPEDFRKAENHLREAELLYTKLMLSETLSESRVLAGNIICAAQYALMMLNKKYFRRGVRRAYEELRALEKRPSDICELITGIILSEREDDLKASVFKFLQGVKKTFDEVEKEVTPQRPAPSADNITGSYEEFFSNWRNKLLLAAKENDPYLSFMSLSCAAGMFEEIAEEVDISAYDVMRHYDPENLQKSAEGYICETDAYLREYEKAGIEAVQYGSLEDFLEDYLGK